MIIIIMMPVYPHLFKKQFINKSILLCKKVQTKFIAYLFSFLSFFKSMYHPGYSEDGGVRKGEIIPEHEFAAGPICLDDENEFPPVSMQNQSLPNFF